MSTTATAGPDSSAPTAGGTGGRRGLSGLLRAEWIKLSTLRSSWAALVVAAAAVVGLGWAFTAVTAAATQGSDSDLAASSALSLSLAGVQLAWIFFGVLGVVQVTGEYTHGSIGPTFAAEPRRWPTVAAKALVLGGVLFLVGGVAVLGAIYLGQVPLGAAGVSLVDDGVGRVALYTAIYLAGLGLIGQALGWLLRSTAGAVAALFGIVFLVTALGRLLPASWGPDVVRWLPAEAGAAAQQLQPADGGLSPTVGLLVFLSWVLVLLVAAARGTARRDA